MSVEPEQVARQLAQALDRDDFDRALALLSSHCVYEGRTETLIGRDAVVQSYREASEWGKGNLDRVSYSSDVRRAADNTFVVRYTDRIAHAGRSHTYQCEQVLYIGADGAVARITHVELPGQREALLRFFAEVGVSR